MSQQNSIVEQCFRKRASESGVQQLQSGGKWFRGGIMNNHGSKKVELDSLIKSCENLSRYTMRRPALLHHELTASSLGNVCQSCIAPLHLNKTLRDRVCTHTERRCRRSREITNHLRSLRKKGKERQKEKRTGQAGKIGVVTRPTSYETF